MVLLHRTREWEREAVNTAEDSTHPKDARNSPTRSFDGSGRAADTRSRSRRLGGVLASFGTPPWIAGGELAVILVTLTLFGQSPIASATVASAVLAVNGSRGLYRSRLAPSAVADAPALLGGVLVVGSLIYMLSENGTATLPQLGEDYGRGWWAAIAAAGVALVLVRGGSYLFLRWIRRTGIVGHRTLIVGAGLVGSEIVVTSSSYPEYGLKPVAFHDPEPLRRVKQNLPILTTTSLGQSIRLSGATIVVIGYSSLPDSKLVEYLQRYHREGAEFFLVPRLYELDLGRPSEVEQVRSLSLRRLRRAAHRTIAWKVKLIMDRLVAGDFRCC